LDPNDPFELDDGNRAHLAKHVPFTEETLLDAWFDPGMFFVLAADDRAADWLMIATPLVACEDNTDRTGWIELLEPVVELLHDRGLDLYHGPEHSGAPIEFDVGIEFERNHAAILV
jgi:hypothetical protein